MSKTSFTGFLDKKGVDECEWEEKRVLIQVTGKQAGILHWIAYCHFSEVRWECSCVLRMNKSLSLIGHCLLNSDVTHLTDRHRLENQHKNECRFRFKRKSVKYQHHFQVISTIFSFVQKKKCILAYFEHTLLHQSKVLHHSYIVSALDLF